MLKKIFLFFIFLSINSVVFGVVFIDNCTTLDVAGETYKLTADILNSNNSTCFKIQADYISLDCQGHVIDGIDSASTYGIEISGNVDHIEIHNCNISDWDKGIFLNGGNINYNNFTNLDISSNLNQGIYLSIYEAGNFNDNYFSNIEVYSNGNNGLFFSNRVYHSYKHYYFNNNVFENINTYNNTGTGLLFETGIYTHSANNLVENISSINNQENGIALTNKVVDFSLKNIISINNSNYNLYFTTSEINTIDGYNFTNKKVYSKVSQNLINYELGPLTLDYFEFGWNGLEYTLNSDRINLNQTVFKFISDNISLDCQNHIIDGTDTTSTYGIEISENMDYIQVHNCDISDWDRGIFLNGGNINYCTFTNLDIFSNLNYGFYSSHSERGNNIGNSFENLKVYDNGNTGLYFKIADWHSLYDQVFRENNFKNISSNNNNGDGMHFENANSNMYANYFENITTINNSNNGFTFQYAGSSSLYKIHDNSLKNIISENNFNYDIYFSIYGRNNIDGYNFTNKKVYSKVSQNLISYELDPITLDYFKFGWNGLEYTLNSDRINLNQTVFKFISDNISLDCQNHIIDGTDTTSTYGIEISENMDHNEVHNCKIKDWDRGIFLNGGNINYCNFTNLEIYSNLNYGIYSSHYERGSNIGNYFENLEVYENGNTGLYFSLSDHHVPYTPVFRDNIFKNIVSKNNVVNGLTIKKSGANIYDNYFENITTINNSNRGISFEQGTKIVFTHNNNIFKNIVSKDNINYNLFFDHAENNIIFISQFDNASKISLNNFNFFNTSNEAIGNYYEDLICLENEHRVNNGYVYEVCINPSNYTINLANNVYDFAPLASLISVPVALTLDYASNSPVNGVVISNRNWTMINVTSSGYNLSSCTLNWDGSDESMFISSDKLSCYLNKSITINATYSYFVEGESLEVVGSQTLTRSVIFGSSDSSSSRGNTSIFPGFGLFSLLISLMISLGYIFMDSKY